MYTPSFKSDTFNAKLQIKVLRETHQDSKHQRRMAYSSQPVNTTMHICYKLTVEHPIQIKKGFIDV